MLRRIGSNVRSPGTAPRVLGIRFAQVLRLRELAVDHGLHDMPREVGEQHDHDRGQGSAQRRVNSVSLAVSSDQVDLPGVRQQQRRADDERGAQAALEGDGAHARRPGIGIHAGRSQHVIDRALGHADRGGQGHRRTASQKAGMAPATQSAQRQQK